MACFTASFLMRPLAMTGVILKSGSKETCRCFAIEFHLAVLRLRRYTAINVRMSRH
jgi:hypothetical protein